MKRLLIQRVAFLLISTLLLLALGGMGGKPSSGNMVFPADSGQAYASLADAMQSDGFSTHCLPTWIPEDYSITFLQRIPADTSFLYFTTYESDRGAINLVVNVQSTATGGGAFESDGEGYSIIHNDTEFFIYTNTGDPCAVWQMEEFLCSIDTYHDGDMNGTAISEEELLDMIYSIEVNHS